MLLSLASRYEAPSTNVEEAYLLAKSGAMSIASMIDIADAVDPMSLLVLPFIGQPLYHAAMILIDGRCSH